MPWPSLHEPPLPFTNFSGGREMSRRKKVKRAGSGGEWKEGP